MFKIFVKSIFITFLIIILFVNLTFFANGMHYLGVGLQVDYSDKYFGFSTLYQFFTFGFIEDSGYLVGYQNFLNNYLTLLRRALYGNWIDLITQSSGNGFIDVLRGIGNVLISIGSILGFIFYAILMIIYGLSVATWIILKFFSIAFGGWYSYLPPNPYDIIPPVI